MPQDFDKYTDLLGRGGKLIALKHTNKCIIRIAAVYWAMNDKAVELVVLPCSFMSVNKIGFWEVIVHCLFSSTQPIDLTINSSLFKLDWS